VKYPGLTEFRGYSLLLPIYTWWQLPYYYAGCKLYDFLAGKENMESAYWMGRGKALEAFPMLKDDGLVGGVVYYDGECPGTSWHVISSADNSGIASVP
jgi:glycerol-3-phosphate dehydrogenase